MTNCDFLNIGFIGFGLIGGSIAKAIKAAHPEYHIIVESRSREPLIAALNDKIIDDICTCTDDNFSKCDYIFLCTPVITITKYMSALKPFIKPGCIITDVGSVKGNIHKAAHELGLDSCFIGGHPMAGSELSGYANSSADILKDSKYVITPTADTSSESLESYVQLIKDMKAVPVIMDYKEHDYTVAAISHVPHLIAAGLTRTVKTNDDDENTCIFLLPVVSATQQELRHLHRKCGVRFATQIKIQYAHFLINSSKKCTISGIISTMTPRKKHLNLLKIYLKKPAVIENLSKPPLLTIKRGSILRQQIPSLLN